ncbi:MAG TPA: hypothetical protein VF074_24080 [Pyrinomonadaceae bacterium]
MKNRMKVFSVCFYILVLCSLFTFPVVAQSDNKEPSAEEQKRKQELERKTLLLLDEVVTASSSLKLPENRIFILCSAANLVWRHDVKRARSLFWEAINALNVVPSPKTSANDEKKNTAYFETYNLRSEILNMVARRDPQLALEMLHASRQTIPESADPSWIASEQGLEHQIAAVAAERDPKRALQLARESLSKGLSLQLLSLLSHLNQNDPELGTKFAGEVVDKIRSSEISNDLNAYLAFSLLSSSRPISENSSRLVSIGNQRNLESIANQRNLELPKEQRRALTEMLANFALSVSANSNLLYLIPGIMPEIEEFVPERVLLLKRRLSELNRKLPQREKDQRHYSSLVRNGSPEEVLRAALNSNDEERLWLEREAILQAVFSKKTEALRELIAREVPDESKRKSMLDSLDAKETDLAVQVGDAEALRKLLPKITLKEQRARALAEVAVLLETKGKHDEALNLLEEAQGLVTTDLRSETKSNALLGLMLAYALIEPGRAFVIAERTIDKANDELSKLLLFDKLIKTGFLKKGEIVLGQSGVIHPDFALFKYGKGITALARADFSRTRAAADRFERYELRILARLLIAQAVLNGDQYSGSRFSQINMGIQR